MYSRQIESGDLLSVLCDSTGIGAGLFVQRKDGTTVEVADGTPGVPVLGVSVSAIAANAHGSIVPMGRVARVKAGAALNRGTLANHYVTTNTAGKAIAWTAGSGLPKLGYWLPESDRSTATVSVNDEIVIELCDPASSDIGPVYGTATISTGTASEDIALDVALDGATVFTQLIGAADATLLRTVYTWPSADGTLRITGNANATADVDVVYFIPGV